MSAADKAISVLYMPKKYVSLFHWLVGVIVNVGDMMDAEHDLHT